MLWLLIERNADNKSNDAHSEIPVAASPGYLFKEEPSTYNKVSAVIQYKYIKNAL